MSFGGGFINSKAAGPDSWDLETNSLVGEGGAAGIYIDSAGQVGIGNTNPAANLVIGSGSGVAAWFNDSGEDGILIDDGGATGVLAIVGTVAADFILHDSGATANAGVFRIHNATDTVAFEIVNDAYSGIQRTILLLDNATGNIELAGGMQFKPSADSTTAIQFANNAGTAFVNFDTTNSRLGIGTTAPLTNLHVGAGAGVAAWWDGADESGILIDDSTDTGRLAIAGAVQADFILYDTAATADRGMFRITNADNTVAFQIVKDDFSAVERTMMLFDSATGDVRLLSGAKLFPSADSTTAMQFANNAGTAFVNLDTTNSRVGIGTTAPTAELHVAGNIQVDNDGYIQLGSANGFALVADEDTDQAVINVGSLVGDQLIIGGYLGAARDYDHASTGDVKVYIHATVDPDSDNTPWLGLSHDDTNALIDWGKGDLTMSGGNVGIGATAPTPAAQLHVDQSAAAGAVPVLTLDQGDVSEEFIRLIGTSAADNSQSLVDAADLTTPGAIVGWYKMYVEDVAGAGDITDAVYYVPFYATPTA